MPYTPAQKRAYARKMARARESRKTRKPRKSRVSGRGFYKGFGRDLGSFFGKAASAVTGIPGLSSIGAGLGQAGANLTGWGAYHSTPIQKNSVLLPQQISISNPGVEGAVQIRHREYIGDILSAQSFTRRFELPINPGLPGSFPWLSALAGQFSQYMINGMIFEYVPASGNAVSSTNNALGQVLLSTQYDSLDSAYANKQQMLNTDWASSGVPSAPLIHPIECAPNQTSVTKLYVRSGAAPANSDKRLFDLGRMTVAVEGQQADDINLGSLYCVYDVLLFKPESNLAIGKLAKSTHLRLDTVTNTTPLGASQETMFDSIGVSVSGQTVTFDANQSGKYMMICRWVGSSTGSLVAPLLSPTNITNLSILDGGSGVVVSTPGTGVALMQQYTFELDESNVASTIPFGASGTLPASVTQADIWFVQLNYDIA